MTLRTTASFALAGLLAFLAVACGSGSTSAGRTATSSPTPAATRAMPAGTTVAPRDLSALPPALAETVRAVERGDGDAVVARIVYKREGCVVPAQLGTPPQCEDGQPVGTLVDAFTVAGCDGSDVPPADAERAVRNAVARPLRLYAVWRLANFVAAPGQFGVMFVARSYPPGGGTWLSAAADGTFTGIFYTCESPDDHFASSGVTDFIIPPE